MKWNRMAYLKLSFIGVFALMNFLDPTIYNPNDLSLILMMTIGAGIGWTIIGTVLSYIIAKFFNGKIKEPQWNDSPFRLSEPLIFLQFSGIGALAFGVANILSLLITE